MTVDERFSNAKWIRKSNMPESVCPVFMTEWKITGKVKTAILYITALGVYEAMLNKKRISSYVLAPGWTVYEKRLQYQQYDVSKLLKSTNQLEVVVGKGWFASPMPGFVESEDKEQRKKNHVGMIAELVITYEDGSQQVINSNEKWKSGESEIRFSEIYDGEKYDANYVCTEWQDAESFEWDKKILMVQEGEEIRENERVSAREVFVAPNGDVIVDFGQELTGYVEFTVNAKAGDRVNFLHGEVLDKNGNFYNANYGSAKAEVDYICKEGIQTWHPHLTFFGFRYIMLKEFPETAVPEQFTAIVVGSDIKQTGYILSSDNELNQLFSNVFWSQRGNFLDVPTDCPQRDERLGWTGDAQVFIKTASYNFDVEKFFRKWLHDIAASQRENGEIGQVIPDYLPEKHASAGWGDAATICPWQIYMTYGNKEILEEQFDCMKKWVNYITDVTEEPYLWIGGQHFGDWLGLDAAPGSYKGATRDDFVATAFYAYSTKLVIKAGHVIGRSITEYEKLYSEIVKAFRKKFSEYTTQTECVLAVWFELAEEPEKVVAQLAEMVKNAGNQLQTGFLGTPYLLFVLSKYGYTELAYTLLLRREYPSWLYPVGKGATTIWEHWDGIQENGEFWDPYMNSFNHYAYGSVAGWVYEQAAGIQPIEEAPGFKKVLIEPHPDSRLKWLMASMDTRHGKVSSRWEWHGNKICYQIESSVEAEVRIGTRSIHVKPGKYIFWE